MKKQGFFIYPRTFAKSESPAPPEWSASLQLRRAFLIKNLSFFLSLFLILAGSCPSCILPNSLSYLVFCWGC